MKRILLLSLLCPMLFFAQTTEQIKKVVSATNATALKSFASQSRVSFLANKTKAIALAKIYNWPLQLKRNDTYSELVGVSPDNLPIYYSTFNYGAGVTSRANKLYTGSSLGLNINGEDMLAGVWDAGNALPAHELFSNRSHVMDNTQFSHYHSTHVAGTIMGSDQFQNGNARGMAYKASVNSYDWNADISEVANAAANGLLISNHSYGRNPFFVTTADWGKYDLNSQSYDEIMSNAPYYQFVCAAGNSRGDYNTEKEGYDVITGHGLSKNGITVAAVKEVLDYSGPASVEMSSFSSWGPTDDGRIKPDISAKGVDTFSALDNSTSSYGMLSGTSMAAPSVAGTLLLFQQYYNQLNASFMKAATLRGLMIHTADEAGNSPGPDYSFGWGLINAEKAADVITKNQLQSFIQENTLTQGNSYSVTVNSLGTEPLLATLCWTDPRGAIPDANVDSAVPQLVNDLDIRITQNTDTYFPWKLDVAHPSNAAIKGDNTVDNVEKAEVTNPFGSYTITVSNKGTLQNNTQHYSLIISGIAVKDFWITATQQTQLVCDGTDTQSFIFSLQTKSNFTENVVLSAVNLPAGVTADFTPQQLLSAGNFSMNLSNLAQLSPGLYAFVVKATSASDSFEMPVNINILSPTFSSVVLSSPANNANSVGIPAVLSWQTDTNAEAYDIEVATDSGFTSIVASATVVQNHYSVSALSNSSIYFWRVKPTNRCGEGVFSNAFTFSTVCGLPTMVTQLAASTTSATLGWTENSGATSWEVEFVPQGTPPTGTGTIISANPYIISALPTNTCYDFYVRSLCGMGTSEWTTKFTFCSQPDYCGGDHFYDSGGATGNYGNFENKTTVIYPENPGERIRAIFNSFHLDAGWDFLKIYNGPSDAAPLIYSGTGTMQPGSFAATNASGALTFVFTSDIVENYSGWDATIICEPMPACPVDPTNITLVDAGYNTATLSWTENLGSTSWDIEIVDRDATPTGVGTPTATNPYNATGLQSNHYYDFYVRSICSGGTSGWAGPFRFNTDSNYCAGDHFYDQGGPNADYPNNYAVTVISPNAVGNRVKATFNSFDLGAGTYFNVYNGPDISYPLLFSYNNAAPPVLKSTHVSGTLTFEVFTFGLPASGWDATIVCEPLPPCPNPPGNFNAYNITTSSAVLYWSENSNATSWEIEVVPHNTVPTGTGAIITQNSYTKNGLASNTWYDVYVRSRCGNGNSDWSLPFTFNTAANHCAGDHFYDSGGPDSNYRPYEQYSRVIYPTGTGNRVKAIFNNFDIGSYAQLVVCNGPYSSSPVLYTSQSGVAPGTLTATNPSGVMSFYFNSNNGQTAPGWDASIICEPLSPCFNPPSGISATTITTNSARLHWTENALATSWEIEIVPHGTTPTGIGTIISTNPYLKNGLTSNTWYDCYVRSRCGGVNSTWSAGYTFHTSANYCAGDHYYDDAGPADDFPVFAYENQTIYPTSSGARIKAIFNSFNLVPGSQFIIYNGPNSSYPELYRYNSSNPVAPGTVVSTHLSGTLTFNFNNYTNAVASGWDASIICEPLPPCSNAPSYIYINNILTNSAQMSWNENAAATSWEIEIVAHGTAPTGTGSVVTTNPYLKTGLTSNTWYDFYVRSKCGAANSTWTGPIVFHTKAAYCSGDHFYDNGGPNDNPPQYDYSNTLIAPTVSGDRIRAVFNSFQLNQYDSFRVYNGPNSSFPILFSYNGSNAPGTLVSTHISGSLYFSFDGNFDTAPGWDALIQCEPLPPCSGVPTNLYTGNVTTSSALLFWAENSNASSWEVEIVPHGTIPTGNGTIVNSNPYLKSGLTSNTWYDFYVRSRCGSANSVWSAPIVFNTKADYCAGDHLYDTGGPNDNYPPSQYWSTSIHPDTVGQRVKAIFNTFEVNQNDYFVVYNGPNESHPILYSSNNNTDPGTLVSTDLSGALTFYLYGYSGAPGWDATIICEPIPPCAVTPSNLTATDIMINDATLSWVENTGATSWEIKIVPHNTLPSGSGTPCNTTSYNASGLATNTCYDFYVRSVCGTQYSAWSSLHAFCTLPDYCNGDHFYDSGGANAEYQDYENWTRTIYPLAAGNAVKVTFNSFELENGFDYLRIYNGPEASGTPLLTASGTTIPGSYTSTHATGALTFNFTSDSSVTRSGWDATINCQVLASQNPEAFSGMSFHPNPVVDRLTIESKTPIESYQVFDVNGRLILENKVDVKAFSIPMERLASGAYFVKLSDSDSNHKTIKVLKQ